MSDFLNDIQVALVVYNRPFGQTPAYKAVCDAAGTHEAISLAVFDNSPNPAEVLPGDGTVDLEYFHQPDNPGIGKSYNQAAELAGRKGKKWLLFFDHDTEVTKEYFDVCSRALREQPDVKLFCPKLITPRKQMVSPFRIAGVRSIIVRNLSPGVLPSRGWSVANSGMLIRLECFEELGGYHPDIKLDFSDTHFFKRFTRKFQNFCVLDASLTHTLDSESEQDRRRALHRFGIYCSGARLYAREFSPLKMIMVQAFLRAIKLSFRWKNPAFLKVFLAGDDTSPLQQESGK